MSGVAYDLFVMHSLADDAWVNGFLVPALNLPADRLCTRYRFERGASFVAEVERAIEQSRFTVIVLTPSFVSDEFAQVAETFASHSAIVSNGHSLIPLLLAPCILPIRVDFRVRLDCTDAARWETEVSRLRSLLDRPDPQPETISCPYPGMVPFTASDTPRFFGREKEIDQMLQHLRQHRLLLVIGSSGSGKSSLISAGMLPRFRESGLFSRDPWTIREFRPGRTPAAALSTALGVDVRTDDLGAAFEGSRRLLLVIDQFEETFTQSEGDERRAFIRAVHALRAVPQCSLVLAIRADFLASLMESELWPIDFSQRFEIPRLRGDALRAALAAPAAKCGVQLEPALVEQVLHDAADEPGALPLLQEAMVLLWEKRHKRLVTMQAYRDLGTPTSSGLAVAIATKADATMAGLPAVQQTIARRIYMRLVQFGEGRSDTRRQLSIEALRSVSDDPALFQRTLQHLIDARLLTSTSDDDTGELVIDIAHEALLTAWPQFRTWLDARQKLELQRRRLDAKADEWVQRGRGAGGLLDPFELREAEQWMASDKAREMGTSEALMRLLNASRNDMRRKRLIKRVVLAAILVLLAGWGFEMWQKSRLEREGYLAERNHALVLARDAGEKAFALSQMSVKEGTQSVAKGDMSMAALWFAGSLGEVERAVEEMRGRGVDAGPADQVRCDAHRQRLSIALRQIPRLAHYAVHPRLVEADVAADGERVVTASYTFGNEPGVARLWDPLGKSTPLVSDTGLPASAVAFRPDGWLVAVGFGEIGGTVGEVQIWEARSGAKVGDVKTAGAVRELVFSPAHDRVAFWVEAPGAQGGEVTVWDRTTGEIWAQHIETGVNRIAFNPEADRVAIALGDARKRAPGEAMLWTFAAPRGEATAPLRIAHEATVNWVDFSPDGAMLVTASGFAEDDAVGEARVWDAGTGALLTVPLRHARKVDMAAFSPDGRLLVTASSDSTARIWDVRTGRGLLTLLHDGLVYQASFSPDGRHVVTGSRDRCARVWDLATGRLLVPPLRHEGTVFHVAFADDGRRVVVGGRNAVRVWDLMTAMRPAPEFERAVSAAAFSADGERILTAAEPDNRGSSYVEIVKADGEAIKPRLSMPGPIRCVAFSPDGKRIAAAGGPRADGAEARVWMAGSADTIGNPLKLRGEITGLAMAPPDGRRLLVISRTADRQPGRVTLWEPETGKVTPLEHAYAVSFVAFSPDGTLAVTGSGDTIVRKGAARVFDAATGELRGELPHNEAVTFASFDSTMERLATGGVDDAAVIWDVSHAPFRQIVRIEKVHSADLTIVKFSPDGRTLLTAGHDRTAALYDLAKWTRDGPATITWLPHDGVVVDATFSPDGSRVITASADRNARVWDAHTGDLIAVLPHQAAVRSVAFDAEGKRALTLSFASVRNKSFFPTGAAAPAVATSRLRLEEARVWDVAPSSLSTGDLRASAQLLAAATIAGGTPAPASLEESDDQWQRLRADYLAQVPRLPAVHYHLREAAVCEAGERWFAAASHLEAAIRATGGDPDPRILRRCGDAFASCDRWAEGEHYFNWTLLSLSPDDKLWASTIYQRLRMRTELHRWDEAIADCQLMQKQDPKDHEAWAQLATIHLDQAQDCARRGRAEDEERHWRECLQAMGDAAERAVDDANPLQRVTALQLKLSPNDPAPYLKACEDLWAKFHHDPRQAIRIAWPYVLDPRSDLARLRELLPAVEKAVEADPNYFRLNTLGAVYFRTGQYDKAREALDRSRKVWAEVQVRESLAQLSDESASAALAELEDGRPHDQVFLAMSHYQLSRDAGLADATREQHATEAQRWLRKALDSYDQIQRGRSREAGAPRRLWNELEFSILLQESTRMIERSKISAINP